MSKEYKDYEEFVDDILGKDISYVFVLMNEYGVNDGLVLYILIGNDPMSLKEIREFLPFLSIDTIRRAVARLSNKKRIYKTRKLNQHKFDTTVYYGVSV